MDFAQTLEIGEKSCKLKVQTNGVRGFIPLMLPQNDEDAYYRDQHAGGPGEGPGGPGGPGDPGGPGGPGGPSGPGGPGGFPFGGGAPAPAPVYEEKTLSYDDVVISGGRKPRTEVADSFKGTAPVVKVIGDTLEVSNIKRAVYSGYKAAMQL